MKVSINRDSAIPLHDQLVTQIALLIASGALPPGRRLPSVRDLANRLSVHRNTVSAVYKTLETYGIVTVKAGSGVRVIDGARPEGALSEGVALRDLAQRFVGVARARGYEDGAIQEAFELALRPERVDRIVVVDPHEDFHPLYLHELRQLFACPMRVMTFEALSREGPAFLDGAALLSSMYHLGPLRELVGGDRRVIVFQVSTPEPLLAQLRTLQAGASVGLVSVSDTMLRMAKEVIAALRGEDLDVLEAHPDDADGLKAVLKLADLIMSDGPSEAAVRPLVRKPFTTFRLIPEGSLRSLAQQLPASALA